MRGKRLSIGLMAILAVFTVTMFVTSAWAAAHEKVLYSFNNNYPYLPGSYGGLISDAAGNLYGTTEGGGAFSVGTVFELTPTVGGGWTEKVLWNFGSGDGSEPYAGLISDAAGNLYGTTDGGINLGVVFELMPTAGGDWTYKVLHSFTYDEDGVHPDASLILDASGNLYGTTSTSPGMRPGGTVFEMMRTNGGDWREKVLYAFRYSTDGVDPFAGLMLDAAGNLYGTTAMGGSAPGNNGYGTVFELTPTAGGGWTETASHIFESTNADGAHPLGGLISDGAGNLYGTTYGNDGYNGYGYGTVFELTRTNGGWREKVLHIFNGTDGAGPRASLILDAAGNLYGTTVGGGTYGYGTVFELTPIAGGGWTERVLHNFNNDGTDGAYPYGGLIFDGAGNLYGTTAWGGTYGNGTVFEITP